MHDSDREAAAILTSESRAEARRIATRSIVVLKNSEVSPMDMFVISVPVTNASSRDGDEVVQLYMRDPVASISRPKLELRGFARINIPAGQTRTVTFTLSPEQAAIYTADGEFRIEEGRLDFFIGAASDDLRGTVSIKVVGTGVTRRPPAAIETGVRVQ